MLRKFGLQHRRGSAGFPRRRAISATRRAAYPKDRQSRFAIIPEKKGLVEMMMV
ncbi:MAG TPA: hypothetical protein VFC67_14055 [Prolixibacteraceae bacterium]|nr:hypothetical protein [Prolixibacteraceae bacterium]